MLVVLSRVLHVLHRHMRLTAHIYIDALNEQYYLHCLR